MGGKSIISNSYLEDIGDAIRYKKGTDETFYPSQMGDAIRSIEGIVPTGTMEIDANGVYNVTEKAEAVVSVEPNLESLSVTENGLYLPESGTDGFDRVLVNTDVQWDGTLYPITDESDALYADHVFNAKHISVVAGDTVIVEGTGRGRLFGWYRGNRGGPYSSNSVTNNILTEGFTYIRYTLPITVDATLVLAGYEWTNDGTHNGNAAYCFFGEYLHWKVIHQP